MADARYYDPETGRPMLDEWIEVIGQSDAESTVRELARLERERDTEHAALVDTTARLDAERLTNTDLEIERDDARREAERLRSELRQARRRLHVAGIAYLSDTVQHDAEAWAVIENAVRDYAPDADFFTVCDTAWSALHAAGLVEDEE